MMSEVTQAKIAPTMGIHIDRAATRVQSAEEDAAVSIMSDSVIASEREVNRGVFIMY
jgi:hypothetical protein